MLLNKLKVGVVCLGLFSLVACGEQAPADNEIIFWHAFSGNLGKSLNEIVDEFNHKHPELKVKTINKGSYEETLNAGIAAFRSNSAPDILQVYEVGTATMMHAGDITKSINDLMKSAGIPLSSQNFLAAIGVYYSDSKGKLLSLPFNSSTPVFYYNKDAFKQAGLDAQSPPKTLEEVKEISAKIMAHKSGNINCGLTISWPAWVLIENGSARNNAIYATKNNGFGGLDARVTLKHPYYKKILTDLSDMSKNRRFVYGGRGDKPSELFTTGQCAMLIDSSGSYADIKANSKFNFSVSALPYYASLGAPKNSIIGGASLWVFSGKTPKKYQAIATFLNYLSSPEVMAKWHQQTGYIPVTKAAYELSKKQGFYQNNPQAEVPIQQLNAGSSVKKGIRLGNLPVIRDLEDGELEKVFNHQITPEQAIKNIENLANAKLKEFEETQKK